MDPAPPADRAPDQESPEASPPDGADVIRTLKRVALFEGLDDDDLARIRDISEPASLAANETLFEEGEKGETFHVILDGRIELSKSSAKGRQKLAVLRAGQAFGEMALLNRAPRSATARAVAPTRMLTISSAAFESLLGGNSLALRVMKALSRALWATSVRLTAKETPGSEAKEAVGELNRVVRGQLTSRKVPSVAGYDIAALARFNKRSQGAATWDTFLLEDGRTVLALTRAEGGGMLHAQNLAVTRALMREVAEYPADDLAEYVNAVRDALVRVAVPGLSQPITFTLVAISEDGLEWSSAGRARALLRTTDGEVTHVPDDAPPLGAEPEHEYTSELRSMAVGDAFLALAEGAHDALERAEAALARSEGESASIVAARVVDAVTRADTGIDGIFDTIASVVLGQSSEPAGEGKKKRASSKKAGKKRSSKRKAPASPEPEEEGPPVIQEGLELEVEEPTEE